VIQFLTLILALAAGTAHAEEWQRVETEHLVIQWREGESAEAIEAAKTQGEHYFAVLEEMLGHAPSHKLHVVLNGPAEQPDGSWGTPRVDGWSRIHLYRYGPTHHGYFSALAHEMVHAFRFSRMPHHDWFFEEGFAEFVALRVDDSLEGFPWYGYPVDLVVGQWFARDEALPLAGLRSRHRELNMPCKLQAYSLRSGFFDWLGRTHGDEKVLELASREKAGALADYQEVFGSDFPTLAGQWRSAARAPYKALEDADTQAHAFRTRSPAQYQEICDP